MFKVSLGKFESVTQNLLQATQDMRVVQARSKASFDSVAGKSSGSWIKTGALMTGRFSRRVKVIEGELIEATGAYKEAYTELSKLRQQQQKVFNAFGVRPTQSDLIIYSEQDVKAQYVNSDSVSYDLVCRIGDAQNVLSGIENAGDIARNLSDLRNSASTQRRILAETNSHFTTYKRGVKSFESTYAKKIGTDRFPNKSAYDKVKDFFSDFKGVNAIPKHIATYAGFISSLIDGSHQVKKFDGVFKGTFDFLRPSKWSEAWKGVKSGVEAQKAGSNAATTTEAITGASKTTTRIKSAGKILGYVGTALTFVTSGFKIADAYNSQEGKTEDKLAAATLQTATEAAKFAAGKIATGIGTKAGAAIGSAICPGVGTVAGAVIGFAIGVAADYGINKLSEWSKESGFHDKAVKAVSGFYRETGKLISNGWKKLWGG